MTLSEFRESSLFKAIADISVVHWFVTIVPGLASGAAAAMHGKPLVETVILYFVGVCALMLVVLHYGTLAWAKYRPKISQNVVNETPRKLWRLIIPVLALVVMLGFGWWAKPKPVATSTGAALATNNGAQSNGTSVPQSSQSSQQPQGGATSQQPAQPAQSPSGTNSQTAKKRKPMKDRPKTAAETKTAADITKPAAQVDSAQPQQPPISPSVMQGPGSAFSINQQGGVTAGTINYATPDRRLTDDQKADLENCLKTNPGKFSVVAMSGIAKAYRYAQDWSEVFSAAGWTNENTIPVGSGFAAFGDWSGLRISMSGTWDDAKKLPSLKEGSPEMSVSVRL